MLERCPVSNNPGFAWFVDKGLSIDVFVIGHAVLPDLNLCAAFELSSDRTATEGRCKKLIVRSCAIYRVWVLSMGVECRFEC